MCSPPSVVRNRVQKISRRYARHPPLVLNVGGVSYLPLLWRVLLPLFWSSISITVVYPTRPTVGSFVLRRILVLYPSGRFPNRIMFPFRCLSCVPPLPFAGTVFPTLIVSHIHSFVIFIPQRWSFCLASSTGFTRLNFFLTYGTSQLSFAFQNRARITLFLGISVQSL